MVHELAWSADYDMWVVIQNLDLGVDVQPAHNDGSLETDFSSKSLGMLRYLDAQFTSR